MSGVQSRSMVIWKILVLCVVCAFCNVGLSYLVNYLLKFPLFADTIFTVAMCFTAGWLPAVLTGILLSNLIYPLKDYFLAGLPYNPAWSFFSVCILAEIVLVYFFHKRIKPREDVFLQKPSLHSFIGVATGLLVLTAFDCIVISILGGMVDFILNKLSAPLASSFEDVFEVGLLRHNVPWLLAGILARIPINIVDRFIAIFGGYGISLIFRKLIGVKV